MFGRRNKQIDQIEKRLANIEASNSAIKAQLGAVHGHISTAIETGFKAVQERFSFINRPKS